MTDARPSILNMVCWAYWDTYQVVRSVPIQILTAITMTAAGSAATLVAPHFFTRAPIGQTIGRGAIVLCLGFFLTSVFLGVHRFMLLGEPIGSHDAKPLRRRLQSYFGCVATAIIVVSIPSLLNALQTPAGPFYYSANSLFPGSDQSVVMNAALRLATLAIIPYCLTLLPAVAIDAPGANWQNVVSDVSRHFWFALTVIFLPIIPVLLLGIAVVPFLSVAAGTPVAPFAGALWFGIIVFATLLLGTVAGARLYQVIGDRLNGPAAPARPR